MRKLILWSCMTCTMLSGCKESGLKPAEGDHQSEEFNIALHDLDLIQLTKEVKILDAGVSVKDHEPVLTTRNPNSSANGHCTTFGAHVLSFSAIENNGGVQGQVEISGPTFNMHLDTKCVFVVNNRATIGGIITQIEIPENFPFPFLTAGWVFYLAVEDNSQGGNSDPERVHANVYAAPPGTPGICHLIHPNHQVWWAEALWQPTTGQSDQILVQ